MKTIIEVNNIHKSYGDLHVLKGINLSIKEREVVSIIGASGAGKSTLLHIMGTLDNADSGDVIYKGKQISQLSASDLADFRNQHIGFIFQFHHLLPEFTALENVCMPAWINGKNKTETEKRAKELLAVMGLSDRALHKPSQLSGGEQQRVSVARALINDAPVIFGDEPSGNLDSTSRNELHNLFFRLRDELGKSFVIVTHDDSLARLSDRTIHLKEGVVF
ncbi:MAG: ABC transporter ATP-binding protein [Marinifilaceae bacterium]